jgi:hypothetical protein
LQLLPYHARPSPSSLNFCAVGSALCIARSVLFPLAAEQEYDQATLMSPAYVFSKRQFFQRRQLHKIAVLPAQANSP